MSDGPLGGETREEDQQSGIFEGWVGFVRVQCLQSHGGWGSGRDLNVQGSLEEERAAIIKIVLGRKEGTSSAAGRQQGRCSESDQTGSE